jgi:hypothetical protein
VNVARTLAALLARSRFTGAELTYLATGVLSGNADSS